MAWGAASALAQILALAWVGGVGVAVGVDVAVGVAVGVAVAVAMGVGVAVAVGVGLPQGTTVGGVGCAHGDLGIRGRNRRPARANLYSD
jgi:hypothetical protein